MTNSWWEASCSGTETFRPIYNYEPALFVYLFCFLLWSVGKKSKELQKCFRNFEWLKFSIIIQIFYKYEILENEQNLALFNPNKEYLKQFSMKERALFSVSFCAMQSNKHSSVPIIHILMVYDHRKLGRDFN